MLDPAAVVESVIQQKEVDKFTRLWKLRTWLKGSQKRLLVAMLFGLCVAPTFISYKSYIFHYDDADYLLQSIKMSRLVWSGNMSIQRFLAIPFMSIRPPGMTLMGLPWGSLASWDDAGKCFVTLAAVISLIAAACLYLLLRIGLKPFFLIVAAICVGASLGPYPRAGDTHYAATGFMADSLVAWTALAAMLLIPYEARTPCPQIRDAALRGVLWGSILSLGIMTKLSFAYFVVLTVPILCILNVQNNRIPSVLSTIIAFTCCSAPSAVYLLLWGRSAFDNAKESSFGWSAHNFYFTSIIKFANDSIRDSPGLVFSIVLTAAALIYLLIKRRLRRSWPDLLAVLIMIGFCVVVLASPNRQVRFLFPAIVALPFLAAVLLSDKEHAASGVSAALAAGLVFCGSVAAGVPTWNRANIQSIGRSNAVVAQAVRCNAKHILLGTMSRTLNVELVNIAIAFSSPTRSAEVGVSYDDTGVEESRRRIRDSDQVVFQHRSASIPDTDQPSLSAYERYMEEAGYVAVKVYDDVVVYSMHCHPSG